MTHGSISCRILDLLQDAAGLARDLAPRTGTHLDMIGDSLGVVADAPREPEGDAWGRAMRVHDALVDRVRSLVPSGIRARPRPSPWFWVVAGVHLLVLLFAVAYPVALVGVPLWADVSYLAACCAVCFHWWVLCGECVLSYLEKALFFESYEMGVAPAFFWFMVELPPHATIALSVATCVGISCAFLQVVLRTFSLSFTLSFGLKSDRTWP